MLLAAKPGKLTDNAMHILKERYFEPGEDAAGMFKRVAGGNPDFEQMMTNLDFLPNSPTLMNAGTKHEGKSTFSACFKFSLADSMLEGDDSIMETARKAASVAKWGGGVGYYLGDLRGKGAPIRSVHRVACGPIAVLKFYNTIGTELITQGGRRGLAQMAILPWDHPDILEFIHVKDKDPQALKTFNISVSANDAFMKTVCAGPSMAPERLLWDELIQSAWKTGDPGLFFVDTAERFNPTPHLGKLDGTNPCVTGSTSVYVADGRTSVTIKQLADEGKDVPVFCLDDDEQVTVRMMRHPRLTGHKEQIIKVTLDDGLVIRANKTHKFRLRGGGYKEVQDLLPGDSLSLCTRYTPEACVGESYADKYIGIQVGGKYEMEHCLIASWFNGRKPEENEHVHHIDEDRNNNTPGNLEIKEKSEHLVDHSTGAANPNYSGVSNEDLLVYGRKLARKLGRRFSREEWTAFVADKGMPVRFSDWREQSLGTIHAFSKQCAILENVKEFNELDPRVARTYKDMVVSGLDSEVVNGVVMVHKNCEFCGKPFIVNSYRRETALCSISCSNRRRNTTKATASNRAVVAVKQDVIRKQQLAVFTELRNKLGVAPDKNAWKDACKAAGVSGEISRASSPFKNWNELKEAASVFNHRVVSVEEDGIEDVYNGTVDDFHNFFVGGWDGGLTEHGRRKCLWINNLQCGEVPLLNNEACNLGSINLARFVISRSVIDWDRLDQVTRLATQFLDNILDRNCFPHPAITAMVAKTRKLGLGVCGWADMLALMRIHYDTPEAVDLGEKVMKFISEVALNESVALGKLKGIYPGYQLPTKECDHGFTVIPCRNATRTCIAPTGTIAIIMNASSGIEPHYALEWDRKLHAGTPREKVIKEHIAVWDDLDGFVPKTANDVHWSWHVKHQAAFQKHTDLAVSKTINLPHDATVDDISAAYQLMWESGCKGGTVFRDRCREGGEQVLTDTKSMLYVPPPSTVSVHNSNPSKPLIVPPTTKPTGVRRKPPREVPSIRWQISIGEFDGYLHAGTYENGDLAEIFFRASREGSTVAGLLDSWAIAFSHALQYGDPLEDLVRKYSGIRFEPSGMTRDPQIPICTSIVDYVVRWLDLKFGKGRDDPAHKGYAVPSGMICPICGSQAISQGGCLLCPSCAWSKCG